MGGPASWSPPLEPAPELDAARFDRSLDRAWRRTSYSDLTARTHEPHVASEPEEGETLMWPASADPAVME